MPAGRRRTKLTIYSVTDGKDADGGPTETEVAAGTAWADVAPLVGRERFAAQQVGSEVDTEILMDWLDGRTLTPKHRLGLGTRRWDLQAVLNVDERNRQVRVLARERV